jgi:hypothetical protein
MGPEVFGVQDDLFLSALRSMHLNSSVSGPDWHAVGLEADEGSIHPIAFQHLI